MTFAEHGAPLLFAVFLWWFSTGAVLWLDQRPRRTYDASMLGASVLALGALGVFAWSAREPGALGAYAAFTAAIVIWGWHELSFLMGYSAGPRRLPCPPDARGWRRFRLAAATLAWHEIAIAATGLALAAFAWGQVNQVGVWTFLILWVMRISAKLNVYLGAPNLTEDFLPDHLSYLKTYFSKKRFNWLLPVSLVASTALAAWIAQVALAPQTPAAEAVGLSLLLALLSLAILEHAFLVVPLPDAALWRWALPQPVPPAISPAFSTNKAARQASRDGGCAR